MTDRDPIKTAKTKARNVSPPPMPAGYKDPYQFEYPKLLVTVIAIVVTFVSTVVYGWLLVRLQGPEVLPVVFEVGAEDEITILFNLTRAAVPLLFAFLTVAVVHELIHGVVFQRYGYEVSYGVHW